MQGFVLSKKKQITLLSGILITIAFISKLGFKNDVLAVWSLAIASIITFIW